MAGIGKGYTKGKKFELKSGNNPPFKMMAGDSPITKDFGIGEGTSPYQMSAKSWKKNEEMREEEDAAAAPKYKSPYLQDDKNKKGSDKGSDKKKCTGGQVPDGKGGCKPKDDKCPQGQVSDGKGGCKPESEPEEGESGWQKGLKIAVAGLTSGLDAVYGSGKILPEGVKFSSDKKKETCYAKDGTTVVKCPE